MSSTFQPRAGQARGRDDAQGERIDTGQSRAGSNRSTSREKNGSARATGLANGLAWFSIGLGLAELLAPNRVARFIGVKESGTNRALLRAFGARELSAGVGILSRQDRSPWVWSRVAGDVMDLSMLGAALSSTDTERRRASTAAAAVLGVTALDVLVGKRLSEDESTESRLGAAARRGIHVTRSITVNQPREAVYAFWRDFKNLPRFMKHLESVEITGEGRSHWTAKAPAGTSVEWDAEVTEDRPNELIAWRSVGRADVHNEGVVRFETAPGGRGTEIHVDLDYEPPGGTFTAALAKLFGEEPGRQVADDLRRFKQVMETGEVMLSDATVVEGMQPARPQPTPMRAGGREPTRDRDFNVSEARP
jgi:uncharacterized membrane protein